MTADPVIAGPTTPEPKHARIKDEVQPFIFDEATSSLKVLDQRLLPALVHYDTLTDTDGVAEAIVSMKVRGAPAIGLVAAYGLAILAAREASGRQVFAGVIGIAAKALIATRPTAVNLSRSVMHMVQEAMSVADLEPSARAAHLLAAAKQLHADDLAANRRLGEFGAGFLPGSRRLLTHCHTGALACGGWGTAIGILRTLGTEGRLAHVYANETRPYLQGARLTAWELQTLGLPVTLLTDAMSPALMAAGDIDGVVVGADRISPRGDVANKIGTYALAIAARYHDLPFIVAASTATIDRAWSPETRIEIEERSSDEAALIRGHRLAPEGVAYRHPAFDITPASLVTAIVTENGVWHPNA